MEERVIGLVLISIVDFEGFMFSVFLEVESFFVLISKEEKDECVFIFISIVEECEVFVFGVVVESENE